MINTNFCNDEGEINPCRSLHLIRRNVGRRNIVSWGGKRDGGTGSVGIEREKDGE